MEGHNFEAASDVSGVGLELGGPTPVRSREASVVGAGLGSFAQEDAPLTGNRCAALLLEEAW